MSRVTDATFGFDTALGIATEAIDRLHSTAHSHHRIIVAEIMGHRAGWLALGAGIAGGADVILIPEIPYDVDTVVAAIRRAAARHQLQHRRRRRGRAGRRERRASTRTSSRTRGGRRRGGEASLDATLADLDADDTGHSLRLARRLEELTVATVSASVAAKSADPRRGLVTGAFEPLAEPVSELVSVSPETTCGASTPGKGAGCRSSRRRTAAPWRRRTP